MIPLLQKIDSLKWFKSSIVGRINNQIITMTVSTTGFTTTVNVNGGSVDVLVTEK